MKFIVYMISALNNSMKKLFSASIIICMLICCTSCNKSSNNASKKIDKESRILIAYFTWADNTKVTDEDKTLQSVLGHYEDIGDSENYTQEDALSSASVVAPGNTEKLAKWIQEYAGGDLFSIKVNDLYPSDYDSCMDRAADEKAKNIHPQLENHLDNMSDYDVIFLGFPNWWYTAPMAIFSFIEEYDLSNKTIVPFCSYGTGGIASSVKDIKKALPKNCNVLEPFSVYRADINQAQSDVNKWLKEIGFSKENKEMSNKKLKLTVNGQEMDITLYDTPTANELYKILPLDLEFEDFNQMEKISYLSQKLSTKGDVDGCKPKVGDLCLYAPWGNLSIFYQDFRYSEGLIPLGHVNSDISIIKIDEDFSGRLEINEDGK